jgi:hypothetical protein
MRKGKARFKHESPVRNSATVWNHALKKNPGILFSAFWLTSIVEEPMDTFLGLLAKMKCWRTQGYLSWPFG